MSRRTNAMNHVHKYYRLEITGLWHCGLCTHYMPGNMGPDPVIGFKTRCWICDSKFILSQFDMETNKPVCMDCAMTMVKERQQSAKESYIEEFRLLGVSLEEFNKLFPKANLTAEDVKGIEPDAVEVIEADEDERS